MRLRARPWFGRSFADEVSAQGFGRQREAIRAHTRFVRVYLQQESEAWTAGLRRLERYLNERE